MNKSEFLKALSKQLKLMPKEDREDALMSSFKSIADEIVKGYESGHYEAH